MSEHKKKDDKPAKQPAEVKNDNVVIVSSDSPKSKRLKLKLNQNKEYRVITAVLVVVILVTGIAIYSVAHKSTSSKTTKFKVTAKQFKLDLVQLSSDHTTLLSKALDDVVDNPSDINSAKSKLTGNTTDITNQVKSIYGDTTATSFNKEWNIYIDQMLAYAVADKKNDAGGKIDTLYAIDVQSTQPLAKQFGKVQPKYGEVVFKSGFGANVVNMTQLVEDHVQKVDPATEDNDRQSAVEHLKVVFGYLADQTIQQNANGFEKAK